MECGNFGNELKSIRSYKPRLHYNVLGAACAWNGATFFRHSTASLHLSFCRADLKISTGPSTGVARLSHTDLFHGTAECLHMRKSWHGTANRGAETDIFGSARHGRRACTVYTLSKFAVPCRKRRCPFKINEVKIQLKYIWFVLVGVCCGLEEGDS